MRYLMPIYKGNEITLSRMFINSIYKQKIIWIDLIKMLKVISYDDSYLTIIKL